ncbi:hypothetical protein HPB50_026296 [Hyalomma asiaticum]|uniref:Uncharacterized protein n=1 Tax=Hyalomma asiaticum TaxID=266040 RepID=A0ACB7TNN3_HYAAI|nr:hypothetical protein HPB50_026296 [Hyalomma asiaticum]
MPAISWPKTLLCCSRCGGRRGCHDRAICGSRERRALWEGALTFFFNGSAAFSADRAGKADMPGSLGGGSAFQKTVPPPLIQSDIEASVRFFGRPFPAPKHPGCKFLFLRINTEAFACQHAH